MNAALMFLVLGAAQHQLSFTAEPSAGCGTQDNFERAVAERLGFSPFNAEGPLRMWVNFRKEKALRVAVLKVTDAKGEVKGERSLTSTGEDCGELVSATALAAALAVDPLLLTRPELPQPDAGTERDLQPVLPPRAQVRAPVTSREPIDAGTPPPFSVERPASSPRTVVSVGPGAAFNQVPTVMLQVTGDVAWEWRWLSVGARVNFTAPSYLGLSRGSVGVSVVTVGGLLCVGARWGACFTTQLGVLSSWAVDVPQARSAYTSTASLGLQPYVDIGFAEAWRLRLQLAAQAQPTTTVLYVGANEVWRSPALSFFALISIGYRVAGY